MSRFCCLSCRGFVAYDVEVLLPMSDIALVSYEVASLPSSISCLDDVDRDVGE